MPHAVSGSPQTPVELLHVHDLPQIYTKPDFATLLSALSLLSIPPKSWDRAESGNPDNGWLGHDKGGSVHQKAQVAPEGITRYLTSIISSSLGWLKDDEEREKIWEAASSRLAKRSGRTAMPAISRTFTIPSKSKPVDISIHEPALTSDNLGFKTWAASYLLAKRLHRLDIPHSEGQQLQVLELGSGTGLVGLAAAAILGACVLLTDLPMIEENLARNVDQNQEIIQAYGGSATTAVLDWACPKSIIPSTCSCSKCSPRGPANSIASSKTVDLFPVVLAADSIYEKELPTMLVDTIATWLSPGPNARVVVEFPRREGFEAELKNFEALMSKMGLVTLEQGDEFGYDDWEGVLPGELQEVQCWWAVFKWANA